MTRDDRYCRNCDAYTPHTCVDAEHERDSSGDWRQCLVCRWTYSGYTGKYRPPDPGETPAAGVPPTIPQPPAEHPNE